MSEKRKPNHICDYDKCDIPVYRRPSQKRRFCSRTCYGLDNRIEDKNCESCEKKFKPNHSTQKYCSKSCANKGKRYDWSTKKNDNPKNNRASRLKLLEGVFRFKECMVEGCEYDKVFDIHRHINGKDGGQYVIGNMFAICPNHHAEHHRKIIRLEKINDFTMRVVEITKK